MIQSAVQIAATRRNTVAAQQMKEITLSFLVIVIVSIVTRGLVTIATKELTILLLFLFYSSTLDHSPPVVN